MTAISEGRQTMVLERAEVFIKEGLMDEFLEVFVARALPLTASFTGLISFKALRGVEDADSVMFLAEWESVEAHLASRPEPAHEEFRRIVLPYTAGAKQTVHFAPV
jgi:heme-degrading monooxygenase HmoA